MVNISLNEAIIHTEKISGLFPSKRSMNAKLKSLLDSNKIVKIKNGLYAPINSITKDIFANRFEIATALFPNACVAYHSALEFYGLSNQMFSQVQVYTEKRNINFYYNGLEYKFIQTNIKEGIIKIEQNSAICITNLERTIIDCIDKINMVGGLEEVVFALSGITYLNEELLLNYLEKYNEKFLYKKVGFLLSKYNKQILSNKFFDICHSKILNKTDNICENKKLPKESDRYWRIVYPAKILNTEN